MTNRDDISNQAETALRQSEEKFRTLVNTAPFGIQLTDLEGRIVYSNPAHHKMQGYGPHELIGMYIWDLMANDSHRAKTREYYQTIISKEPEPTVYFSRDRTRDGREIDVQINWDYIRNEKDQITGIISIVEEITDQKKAEEALLEREQFLKILLESLPIPVFYKDLEGRYKGFNKAFETFFGRPRIELVGSSVFDINPPELAKIYHAKDSELYEKISKQIYESQVKNAHGELRNVVFHKATLTNASGAISGLVGAIMDITENKRAEEENRRFKTIADNAVYGKGIADLEGNLLYVNRFMANIHGYEPEQLIGKHLSLFHSREQIEAVDRLNATMMREGYFPTTTVWHRHQDGRVFPMLMNGNLIRDDYGKPQCLTVSAIDMSAHHLAEEALRESEKRFRSYFNLPLLGFAITSLEKGWLEVNERLCEILGYPREELVTLTWTAITHPEDIERDVAQFNLILEGVSEGYSLDKRFIRKDGSVIHGSISVCCVRKSDQTINYFVALVQDITERKQAEADREKLQAQLQQAQKMEAIGTLAGGIAHDFNNILGAILGYAEMAQEDSPAGSILRKDIEQVITASHRAKDLVKQILAFSRQSKTEHIPVQPALIIKEVLKMLRSSLPSTIAIQHAIDHEAGPILADPTQIHQIMVNLCTNGFHAMEETGGTLNISLKSRDLNRDDLASEPQMQPGRFVQLSIGDTGPGIAPEIREKIFDPYFTTKEVGKGTGMGLAIVHGIAKSYKGFVSCHSVLGKGTVFHVYLPVIAEPTLSEPLSAPLDPLQFGNERILFVDDEEILAEMGKVMLERLGYRVTVRRNSLEALNTFQNQPDQFDLVITDQTMPGMTGIDIARRMLQIRPGMPIILCTGYSSLISEDKAKSLGIKGFAMKPLAKKDIAVLVREVLAEAGTAMAEIKR